MGISTHFLGHVVWLMGIAVFLESWDDFLRERVAVGVDNVRS